MAPVTRPRRQATPPNGSRPSKARSVRTQISYIEPSSDPEDDDSNASFSPSPPTPPRSSRKRVVYTEPGDDPMEGYSQGAVEHFSSTTSQGNRSAPSRNRGRPTRHNTKRKRVSPPQSRPSKRPRIRPFGADKGKRKAPESTLLPKKDPYEINFTGKRMPWHTLPYHILELIFDYASFPLISEDFSPNPSMIWLTHVARLCKAFAEPALSALYNSPPLFPPHRVRNLVDRLEGQNIASFMNYRGKIKHLDFEARDILGRKSEGLDPIDLARLLKVTPQIRSIGTHLLSDNPKWYQIYAHRRVPGVAYPEYMPEMLSNAKFRLQEWIWNANMVRLGSYHKLLRETHPLPAFQTIRTLTFVNYDDISQDDPVNGGKEYTRNVLPDSLRALPALRNLSFKSSPILETMPLIRLPDNLTSLELVDCGVEADKLDQFLQTKGDNLLKLVLNHNRRLNLSWLTALGLSCPKLQVLSMDLIFYSAYATVSDTEPQFRSLLSLSDLPTWPRTLQRLELYHLRKWHTTVAETFFRSLVDAAPNLADLREIRIKASLDESGWRERIAFRDKWTQRITRVFKRDAPPPNPHLKSIATFKAWKAQQGRQQRPTTPIKSKLQKVQVPVKTPPSAETIIEEDSDSDKPLVTTSRFRRSARAKPAPNYNERSSPVNPNSSSTPESQPRRKRRRRRNPEDSSDEDSALEDDTATLMPRRALHKSTSKGEDEGDESFVQGMCNVVDVMIDNLRPTEEQLHESDFLDEEISGDEDWVGDDWEEEGGYAW